MRRELPAAGTIAQNLKGEDMSCSMARGKAQPERKKEEHESASDAA
jgi:hypothetical protein